MSEVMSSPPSGISHVRFAFRLTPPSYLRMLYWDELHMEGKARGFNSVNVALGYRTMTILSPLEAAYEDKGKDV